MYNYICTITGSYYGKHFYSNYPSIITNYIATFCAFGTMKIQLYHCNVGPPVIQQPKRDNRKPVRKHSRQSRVTLHCKASGYGSLIYYWESRLTENHKWSTIKYNTNKTSYTTANTAQYRCNVTNEAGSVVSPVYTVYGNNPLV